jgi:predicted NodU family carbamoyl transferase
MSVGFGRGNDLTIKELSRTRSACCTRLSGAENLCLAGGVTLNCVANGKVLRDGKFKRIWVQPAAGDAGGVALVAYQIHKGGSRDIDNKLDGMERSVSWFGLQRRRQRSITVNRSGPLHPQYYAATSPAGSISTTTVYRCCSWPMWRNADGGQ